MPLVQSADVLDLEGQMKVHSVDHIMRIPFRCWARCIILAWHWLYTRFGVKKWTTIPKIQDVLVFLDQDSDANGHTFVD